MSGPFGYRTLADTAVMLRRGEVTAIELVDAYLGRIEAVDGDLHSYITVAAGQARRAAAQIDAERSRGGQLGPLAGIPIAVKDSVLTRGIPTTENSRLHEGRVPERDAPPVASLRAAGAVIIGKTNMNELGWGLPSEADLNAPPHNPWNRQYLSIGSSSGSGAAAAADLCMAALGTDGGGSARLPAGQHNLVGLKPTHGLTSRSDISEISPMARTALDCALVFDAMTGAASGGRCCADEIEVDVRGWRVGVPRRYIDTAPLEPDVRRAFDGCLEALSGLGVEPVDIRMRGLAEARAANFVVLNAGSYATYAASLRSRREAFGPVARVYASQGAFLSAFDYVNATRVAGRVRTLIDEALEGVRAIAMPVSPFVTAEAARRPGEHSRGVNAGFTAPFNITGHPAMSIPAGFGELGIPIGMQLAGRHNDELSLFRLAHACGEATCQHERHPDI